MISSIRIFKGLFVAWIALCCFLSSAAQTVAKSGTISSAFELNDAPEIIKPLAIGDKVPDIVFENVFNHKTKKAKLSDFKGKLIILDMWAVHCTSCIASFPKMEKLQSQFKDKIQILLVNPHSKFDSENSIKSTLEKNKTRTGFYPSLPIPIHDTILNTYFPHQSVPHVAWIDGNRKLIAVTASEEVTPENIRDILASKKVNLVTKNDWEFDQTKPLLVEGNGGNADDFLFRSIFTGYKEGIGSLTGSRRNEKNEIYGVFILNRSLRRLISVAYPDLMSNFSHTRTITDVKNPAQFKEKADTAFTYCYDLTIPPTPERSFKYSKYLQEDLKRYFNITVKKENRKLNSLVVTVTDKIKDSYSKKEKALDITDKATIKKFIHNYTIGEVIKFLEGAFDKPLLDETGISQQHIDIDFPDHFDFSNTKLLVEVLKKTGFELKEEERDLEILVISDK